MDSSIYNEFQISEQLKAEPWPMDVILYQPYEAEQILLPENASCLAVKTYLKMCHLPFDVRLAANAEFMSPGGRMTKLPVLKAGAFIHSEFESIVSFVEQKGLGMVRFLDEDLAADMRCYVSLVENIFTMAELYMSFVDKEVYETVTAPRIGCVFPWPLNILQVYLKKRNAMKILKTYQWDNMTQKDVIEKVEKCCEALTRQLRDNNTQFFYSENPCALDAVAFGHLFSIITTKLPNNALADTVLNFGPLVKFCQYVGERYKSEWIPQAN